MARMIPRIAESESFNNSSGEKLLFEALKNLPDDFVVFHSVRWNRKNENGHVRWGESDFTVFNPKRGLLVIEVKAGHISCDDGQIIQRNFLTNESKRINPLSQAERSKHAFREIVASAIPENEIYWVEAAVWFTSVKRENLSGKLPPSYNDRNVLFENDVSSVTDAINSVYDYYNMRSQYHSQLAIDMVINSLSPQFDAVPSISTIVAEQEYMFERMTREQSYLLDYLEEQRIAAIQGGAGTGKTMLAVEKARRLSSNERVLFLCFNRLLLEYLKETFGSALPNVDFNNLYALASMALNKETNVDDISQYLNNYDSFLGGWRYKSIIIDEGQDFAEEHIKMLADIAELHDGHFYIFYDKHQLIQQRHSLEWAKSIECRLILSLNCRNTKSIAETSGMPINITKIKMRQEIAGQKPNFYIAREIEEVKKCLGKLIRTYTDNGFTQKQITILTCKTLDSSILSGVNTLGSYKIACSRAEKGILFTTAKKFKGLESEVIFIIDIDESTFSYEENRRVFYVAASRAKHYLDLISCVDESQEKALAQKISSGSTRTPKMAIMSGLKVKIAKLDI